MYGLDSLTEHSTVNVEFSRESVSFMWKDKGLGPGKMGRGGKRGKPGGSSKRVETKHQGLCSSEFWHTAWLCYYAYFSSLRRDNFS